MPLQKKLVIRDVWEFVGARPCATLAGDVKNGRHGRISLVFFSPVKKILSSFQSWFRQKNRCPAERKHLVVKKVFIVRGFFEGLALKFYPQIFLLFCFSLVLLF